MFQKHRALTRHSRRDGEDRLAGRRCRSASYASSARLNAKSCDPSCCGVPSKIVRGREVRTHRTAISASAVGDCRTSPQPLLKTCEQRWTGVDIPGGLCSRLPEFVTPTDAHISVISRRSISRSTFRVLRSCPEVSVFRTRGHARRVESGGRQRAIARS
jgi:hypothetical protein